jgi:hypothetical protein
MRVTCPTCHCEISLDALLESESARRAVARLAEISVPFGALMLRYVALFRPEKRRLSIDRMVSLLEELLPDIERGAVRRKGRDWPAPRDTWRAAVEQVLANRDKGTLTLPLTSHGYLHEVICGMAEKFEAAAERERETARRTRAPAPGPAAGAAPLATVLATAPAAPPPNYGTGPSRAARELRAQMEAATRLRTVQKEGPADETDPQD